MNTNLLKLETMLGSQRAVADALGYTERRYRDFRTNAVAIPKAVELAIDHLLQKAKRGARNALK